MVTKKSFFLIIFTFIAGFNFSCKDKENKKGLDLMPYTIPSSIDAPADVTVSKLGDGNVTTVSINNRNDYDVQVFMFASQVTDMKILKKVKKDEVEADPYFIKIIEEHPAGFIFEKSLGMESKDSKPSYDFRYIEVVGSKVMIYQCGNSQYFSEKDVKNMYKSVLKNK